MTLSQFENSRASGQPVELFYFRYGSDPAAFYAFCDIEQEVEHAGITYAPHPIKRTAIHSQQSLDKSEMTVRVPIESPVSQLFTIYPPSDVVTVTIRRGAVGDPDGEFVVIFTGRVQQSKRDGREAELSCVPASVSIKRSGLRRHYQLTCPHVLYDQDPGSCKANKAAATLAAVVVSAVSSTTVTLPPGWNGAFNADKFIGGMVEWDGDVTRERRTILRRSGDVLTLEGLISGLIVGQAVDVILGCNHQLEDCETLHNNIRNFGGMPFIPQENPINTNPFS